ncbi:hypothetical protein JCM19233_2593 [Vibrio astriarenae]|nr:hypothetical protein JCM19233_2593 [Vibrio sp. C7]
MANFAYLRASSDIQDIIYQTCSSMTRITVSMLVPAADVERKLSSIETKKSFAARKRG